MKVIGSSEETVVLVATKTELANLLGFHGQYSDGFKRHWKEGDQVNVSAMFQKLYSLAQAKSQVDIIRKNLEYLLAATEPLEAITSLVPDQQNVQG